MKRVSYGSKRKRIKRIKRREKIERRLYYSEIYKQRVIHEERLATDPIYKEEYEKAVKEAIIFCFNLIPNDYNPTTSTNLSEFNKILMILN